MKRIAFAFAGLWVLLLSGAALAENVQLTPWPPYHIIGNVYYVGSKGLGIYLFTTPAGNILLNAGNEANVPGIEQSIQKLGFKLKDTKILLIAHAHGDHAAGSAALIRDTGAKYEVMDVDVPVIESGGKKDWLSGNDPKKLYPPAHVDRVLHDGDTVELGGTVLTAHLTPGHTKGCTTWTMTTMEGGKSYHVVVVGGTDAHGNYNLVNDPNYPNIAADFKKTFRVLKSLPVDVFLGSHGDYYGMVAKYAKMKPGGPNVWIDPVGYHAYVDNREQAIATNLAKQQAALKAAH